MAIAVSSSGFTNGSPIPRKYTCDGEDLSPALALKGVPSEARSLALICDDPDAPGGDYVHWVLYAIPAGTTGIAEGAVPAGAQQGRTDFGTMKYGGPCPPPGKPHRYYFKVYALDTELSLAAGATRQELLDAMSGHIIAEGQLMGTYQRAR